METSVTSAVVSTKFRYRIEDILARAGLRQAFALIVGGEDVTQPKPNPEGITRALDLLRIGPHQAVYVGDHPTDARAAKAADVPFFAVLSGCSVRSDFDGLPVIAFLDRISDLPAIVMRLKE